MSMKKENVKSILTLVKYIVTALISFLTGTAV